jgi:hypothetical protein
MKEWLRRREAAAYLSEKGLPTSPLTLQKFACKGEGPEYVIFGNKALYTAAALDAWATARMRPRGSAPREAAR